MPTVRASIRLRIEGKGLERGERIGRVANRIVEAIELLSTVSFRIPSSDHLRVRIGEHLESNVFPIGKCLEPGGAV